jgi:UDP-glucose 4-epimerase
MNLNKSDLWPQLQRLEIDTVFHTAGIARVSALLTDIFPANLQTTTNLLDCVEGARFIFTSSSTVYGNGHAKIEFDEYDKLQPTSAYGASKVACESFIDAYTRLGKINGVSLRLCANVGPGATHGLLKDLIVKVKNDSPTLELFGEAPGSIKPFIHVDDTVRAMVWFAEENHKGGVYNVCTKDVLTVSEVADMVMEQLGVKKEKVWLGPDSTWGGDNKQFSMCNKKINRAGFRLQYNTSRAAVTQAIKENL